MSEPLVSVVVPSYNRAYCLAQTIDSVLQQTHRALEVVLVDDGSTDDTRPLVEERYGGEPRVRYVHQVNAGVSAARNHGLRLARGAYVALLDSDDLWLPWKLEAQVRCLEAIPEAGMIWTDMDAIGPDGQVFARRFLTRMYSAYRWFESRDELFEHARPLAEVSPALAGQLGDPRLHWGEIYSQMILGNLVHTSTVLLRRERLERVKGFNERLRYSGEDYDFHLRTCREGPVAYLDAVSILYQRGREDQLTYAPKYAVHMAQNFLDTVGPAIARDRGRIRLPQAVIDEVLADAHAWVAECRMDLGEYATARAHLAQSLWHKPAQPRTAGFLALSLLSPRVGDPLRRAYRKLRGR